ncbi:MAG TPA: tetratricopeptide repeat protein [Thermodesulfobacteriota bacterium]
MRGWPPAAALLLVIALGGCATPAVIVPTDPLSPDEHVRLGAIYERDGELDLAARSYEAALRRDGQHVAALVGLGNLAAARGDLAEAERRYRRALAINPRTGDALNNLAWVYLQRKERYEEAAALAARALEAEPARTAYYADTLGIALTRAGRPAEGLEALERALAATPAGNHALRIEILGHMAETYRALGREAEARAAEARAAEERARP